MHSSVMSFFFLPLQYNSNVIVSLASCYSCVCGLSVGVYKANHFLKIDDLSGKKIQQQKFELLAILRNAVLEQEIQVTFK